MSAHTYFQLLSVICLTSRTNAGLPLQAQVDYDPELMQPDTRFFAKVSNHLDLILISYVRKAYISAFHTTLSIIT